jgi:hypothetical protein
MLPGEISPNRRLRAVGHTTIVFSAAVRNVKSTKCGVATLRRVAAVACRQIVATRGGSACNRGARVRVAMGSRILHPETGISTRFRRALVGQTPARAVVETRLSTCALGGGATASRSVAVEETHCHIRTAFSWTIVGVTVGAYVQRTPCSIAARLHSARVVIKAVTTVIETSLRSRAFRLSTSRFLG